MSRPTYTKYFVNEDWKRYYMAFFSLNLCRGAQFGSILYILKSRCFRDCCSEGLKKSFLKYFIAKIKITRSRTEGLSSEVTFCVQLSV